MGITRTYHMRGTSRAKRTSYTYHQFRLGAARPGPPGNLSHAAPFANPATTGPSDEPQSGKENSRMKIHLPWIRVTAAAVLVAGVGVNEAAAQYAPYRPIPQQPAAPAAAPAPQQAQAPAAQQNPYGATAYTANRTQPAAPTSAYG